METGRAIYRITTDTHVHTISIPHPDGKTGAERLRDLLKKDMRITKENIDTIKSIEMTYSGCSDWWGKIVGWQKLI